MITAFVECHEGSPEAEGRGIDPDMPCIMLFGRPLPENTPSPEPLEETTHTMEPTRKRQTLRVEMSMGSQDEPFRSVSLQVPVNSSGRATIRLQLAFQEAPESPPSTAAASATEIHEMAAETSGGPVKGRLVLLPPAPYGLEHFGLSAREYNDLWEAWRQGGLAISEIRACHGPTVAQHVLDHWGPLPVEAYLGLEEAATAPLPPDSECAAAASEPEEEESDTMGLMGMWWLLLPGVAAMPEPQGQQDFFALAGRLIRCLERQGASLTVLATVLLELGWDRHDREYSGMYEEYLGNLGLPWECNRDVSDNIDPHHRDILVWMEAELWSEYVDMVEAQSGFETDYVMDLRDRDTMAEAHCQAWRQWAADVTSPSASRPAGSRDRPELPRSRPRCTTEVRHLLLPRRTTTPMQIEDATLWWLHLLGLRDGPEVDVSRALRREEFNNRVNMLQDVADGDVFMVMVGLLRVTAMLWVECCQLVYMHPYVRGMVSPTVEVEVEETEEGDGTMWMQSWKRPRTQAPGTEPVELSALLEDEEEARQERERRVAMMQESEREEDRREQVEQQEAERLGREYLEHRTMPPPCPEWCARLVVRHEGTVVAQSALPVLPGAGVRFDLTLEPAGGPTAGMGVCSAPGEQEASELYCGWMSGAISDSQVVLRLGDDMLAVFRLQREFEAEQGCGGVSSQQDGQPIEVQDSLEHDVGSSAASRNAGGELEGSAVCSVPLRTGFGEAFQGLPVVLQPGMEAGVQQESSS